MAVEKLIVRVGADILGFKIGLKNAVGFAAKSALRISVAFGAAVTAATMVGAKFEQALMETATVAQAFGKDLDALENKARELGKTTAFTATEAAKGMYDLASAGMNTKQIIDATEHAMKLAGATGSEMTQATGLLAASLKQFGLEADQSRRITDTYAAAITNSQLTMEKLSEAMKYAGTTGSALGWSIEQTAAAVAQFANLGLQGTQAGTNFRMAMIQLGKGTDQAKAALSEMGLVLEDVNPETHSFGEILKTLGEKAMSSTQSIDIFGARSGFNMKKLSQLANEGKIDFEAFVKTLEQSQEGVGRTAKMYERMMDTFMGSWKRFWSAMQELGIVTFDIIKISGKNTFTYLADKINEFSEWIQQNKTNIQETLRSLAKFVVWVVGQMAKGFLGLKGTIDGVKFAYNALMETIYEERIKRVTEQLEKFNKALDPETMASKVKGFFGSTTRTFKIVDNATRQAYERLIEVHEGLLDQYQKNKIAHGDMAQQNEADLIKLAGQIEATQAAIENFSNTTINQFVVVENSIDDVSNAMHDSHDAANITFQAIINNIEKVNNKLKNEGIESVNKYKKAWEDFKTGFSTKLKETTESFIDFVDVGKTVFDGFVSNLNTAFSDGFYNIITGQFDSLKDVWSNLWQGMLRTFTDVLGQMATKWAMSKMSDIGVGGMGALGLAGAGGFLGGQMLFGGSQTAGIGGLLGGLGGFALGGPLGAIAGGLGGSFLGDMVGGIFGGSKKDARYTLSGKQALYHNVYTKKFSATRLKHSGKGGEITDALNKMLEQIEITTNNFLQDVPKELQYKINQSVMKVLRKGGGPLDLTITGGQADWKMKDTEENLRRIAKIWENKTEDFFEKVSNEMGFNTIEAFNKYMIQFETAAQASSLFIKEAFMQTMGADEFSFDFFEQNLRQTIFDSVTSGLLDAFLQTKVYRAALQPLMMNVQEAFSKGFEHGYFDPVDFWDALNFGTRDGFGEQLNKVIESLEAPIGIMATLFDRIRLSILGESVDGRAYGGSARENKPYLVGESGRPEIFIPDQNGEVVPDVQYKDGQSRQMVFINQGVLTEADFFRNEMRNYQDRNSQDRIQTKTLDMEGIRI